MEWIQKCQHLHTYIRLIENGPEILRPKNNIKTFVKDQEIIIILSYLEYAANTHFDEFKSEKKKKKKNYLRNLHEGYSYAPKFKIVDIQLNTSTHHRTYEL